MKYLKVTEVAERLSISRGKVYQMVNKGILPSVNLDGCIRIPSDKLNEMLHRQLEGNFHAKVEDSTDLIGGGAGKEDN